MNDLETVEKKLADSCLALAKAVKWRPEPFDPKEVDSVAKEFFRIAQIYAPEKDGDRVASMKYMCGAVDLLNSTISGPNFEHPEEWFSASLETLIGIAEPLYLLTSEDGLAFLSELERGIEIFRSGE
jgi:hypothetical protein